jgi:hypothetical protein
MRRRFKVERIDGLPPKKDGAKSMWNKRHEAERIARLRIAFCDEMKGAVPLTKNIQLDIHVHTNEAGDLDNYITGICDGLMKTRCGSRLIAYWDEFESKPVHPQNCVAIENDDRILSIRAIKEASGENWYSVELQGERGPSLPLWPR